jgi:transposase
MLSTEQQAALTQALGQAEKQGQGWNSVQVATWLSSHLGYSVRVERGRDWLYRLGFSTKSPRTRHAKADAEAQDLFKKSLS